MTAITRQVVSLTDRTHNDGLYSFKLQNTVIIRETTTTNAVQQLVYDERHNI